MALFSIALSFWGCWSIHVEQSLTTGVQSGLFFLLFLITATISTSITHFSYDIKRGISKKFRELIHIYKSNGPLDAIQRRYSCCGSDSRHDWNNYKSSHEDAYPPSCCPLKDGKWQQCFEHAVFHTPCSKELQSNLEPGISAISTIGNIIATVLLISAFLSFYLARAFKNRSEPNSSDKDGRESSEELEKRPESKVADISPPPSSSSSSVSRPTYIGQAVPPIQGTSPQVDQTSPQAVHLGPYQPPVMMTQPAHSGFTFQR